MGNNRKRKRGEVELDDEDDFSKRKRERIEARQQALGSQDEEDGDDFGLAHEEQLKRKQMIADMQEEDMSDDEIKKTLENKDYFMFKKEMAKVGEKNFLKRYANSKSKDKEEDDKLEKCMVDLDHKETGEGRTSKNSLTGKENDAVNSKGKSLVMNSMTGNLKGSLYNKKRVMLNLGLAQTDALPAKDKLNGKLAPNSLFTGRTKKSYTGGSNMGDLIKTGKEMAQANKKPMGLAGSFLKVQNK